VTQLQTNKSVEFSREFFNIFKSLTYSRCSLGTNLVFRKVDDKVVCGRFDEASKNVYFYMIMDEYSFRFPDDTITFNNFSLFLDSCKRQGFNKDNSFKIRRLIDKKGFDAVEMYNSTSSISYRLYDANAYPDDMGFLEELDPNNLDPVMFSFDMSPEEIADIEDICTTKNFSCESFFFIKKKDCLVIDFIGPNDMEYKLRITSDRIDGFDNINIGEEIKFSFSSFPMMNQVGIPYKISLLHSDDNYNVLNYGELKVENQTIQSYLFSPSKVSNE
jgi:hypothetical protein